MKIKFNMSKFLSCGIVVMPILSQYLLANFNPCSLFFLIILGVYIITKREINVGSKHIWFVIYAIISGLVFAVGIKSLSIQLIAVNLVMNAIILYCVYVLTPQYFNLTYVYKFYSVLVYFISGTSIIQFLLYAIGGVKTCLIIPGMTLNYGGGMSSSEFIEHFMGLYNYRTCSVFLEPAMYAAYVLIWLYLKLFYTKERYLQKNIYAGLFVTIALFLTGSSYGILGALVAWLAYAVTGLWKSGKVSYLLFFVPLVAIFIWLYNLDIVQTQVALKINSLNNIESVSSTTIRLLRGAYCFGEFDWVNQIFGCGYGNLGSFIESNSIITKYDSQGLDSAYMSSFFSILCQTGYIGALLYFVPFVYKLIKQPSDVMLFVCFIFAFFTTSTIALPSGFLLIACIYSLPAQGIVDDFNSQVIAKNMH